MIERANEATFDWRVYAGQDIPVQWYFRKDSALPVAVQAWTIEPGESEGVHTHGEHRPLEELYVVISGEAHVRVGGEEATLGPGDAFLARVDDEHDVRNSGTTPLRMIVVWGPPTASIWQEYSMGRRPDEVPGPGGAVW